MGPENQQASAGHTETALHSGGPDRRGGRVAHRQRGRVAAQIRENNDRHRSSCYRLVVVTHARIMPRRLCGQRHCMPIL